MASTGDRWRLGRRPALDGLRGVAVLLVLIHHVHTPGLPWAGAAGVTMFFTLSGFLITSLLLEEYATNGNVDLWAFYVRRARRLLPALACLLVVVGLVGAAWDGFVTARQWFAAATYWMNFLAAAAGPQGALAHSWSLSIEEQFYILWPLALIACLPRWRLLAGLAIAGAAVAAVLRVVLWDGTTETAWRIGHGTDINFGSILIGCALAILLHHRPEAASRRALGLVALGLAVLTSGVDLGGITGTAVLTAATIFCVAQGDGVPWLEGRSLRWFGRRSYGLYLWHYPVAVAVWTVAGVDVAWWLQVVLIVPVSLLLAELSWRLVEVRFLKPRASVGAVEPAKRESDQRVQLARLP